MFKLLSLILLLGTIVTPISEDEDCLCLQTPTSGEVAGTWVPEAGGIGAPLITAKASLDGSVYGRCQLEGCLKSPLACRWAVDFHFEDNINSSFKLIYQATVFEFDNQGEICVENISISATCQSQFTVSVGVFDATTYPTTKVGEYHWSFECKRCQKSIPNEG